MRKYVLAVALLWSAGNVFASPAEAVAAAHDDVRRLPAEQRPYVRYLADYAVPEMDRPMFAKILAVHVNKLSRGPELRPPVPVGAGVYRIDVRDYEPLKDSISHFQKTYEKLRDVDPYFHSRVKVNAGPLPVPRAARGKFEVVTAPWLDAKQMAYLVKETQSQVPILRADWFFKTTAIQANRKGVGYYDFLNLKKRDDFFNLVGLDVKLAQKQGRETAAIVRAGRSGVVAGNRQIFRLGAVDTGYWVTRDTFETDTDGRNAIRNLDDDFKHDAEEHYGFLPNRLFAYYLSDKDGVQQDSAPDKLRINDSTSTSNDGRVHVMLSCVRCHTEGIRPIDDFARKLYRGPVFLQEKDYEKLRRLRALYFSNLQRFVRRDTADYAETTVNFVGLTPKQVADGYRRFWKLFSDDEVYLPQAALEMGVPEARLLGAIKAVARATGKVDPVVAIYLLVPAEGIARDQYEEIFGLLQTTARGFVPADR